MSYFCKHPIYIIIPKIDAENNQVMINQAKLYFYTNYDKLRKSLDGSKILFKVRTPVTEVFNQYEWHNVDSITKILTTAEWEDIEI